MKAAIIGATVGYPPNPTTISAPNSFIKYRLTKTPLTSVQKALILEQIPRPLKLIAGIHFTSHDLTEGCKSIALVSVRHRTLCPFFERASAKPIAGNTCPPVPPAANTTRTALIAAPLVLVFFGSRQERNPSQLTRL